jgi:hypothetical protein
MESGQYQILRQDVAQDEAIGAATEAGARRIAEIARMVRTGIDSRSGLASDFLNQFNEAIMILDLVGDDPDMINDLRDWSLRDYHTHFRQSGFGDAALVLEAYELCPAAVRQRFDGLTNAVAGVVASAIEVLAESEEQARGAEAAALAVELRAAVARMSAIIHPSEPIHTDAEVTALFAARS